MILIVSGIPDSLSCIFGILRLRIPDSTNKMFSDSGFYKQKDSLTWREFLITQWFNKIIIVLDTCPHGIKTSPFHLIVTVQYFLQLRAFLFFFRL